MLRYLLSIASISNLNAPWMNNTESNKDPHHRNPPVTPGFPSQSGWGKRWFIPVITMLGCAHLLRNRNYVDYCTRMG